MPCTATSTNISPGAPPTPIAGFGSPFAPLTPSSTPNPPSGQPEDLNSLFQALELLVPASALKAPLSPNYDKTIFDVIMKLLDGFMPFLSLYKMFLPILNIIVCIIEVICAIPNPFKLIEKIQQLFRKCIPEFLSLFPQFALVIMILSILNLLISLVEYIITEVANLVAIIQNNINIIKRALSIADDRSILAATQKIGNVLCSFQNLFVLLALFETFIAVFKDILQALFNIPPCGDSNGNDVNCCSPDVCPSFIKNNTDINRNTGTLQYFNEVLIDSGLVLPPGFNGLTTDIRKESWQFYDASAAQELAFINITHAFDLPSGVDTVFFPTDANYTATTPISQVPYLVSLRLLYNPSVFGGSGQTRYIRINNCIILNAPTTDLSKYDNSIITIDNGVLNIVGGLAFEDDNTTPIIINGTQATLTTLIHKDANVGLLSPPSLLPTDGYLFSNISYDFKIQHEVLLGKSLITLGCVPIVGFDRTFINTIFGDNTNLTLLNNLPLPDVGAAQLCLATAVAGLQSNVSDEGLATFQMTTTACLNDLKNQSTIALKALADIGFDPYKSTFTLAPKIQFTTETILVSVALNESSGASIANNLSIESGATIAGGIKAKITFGEIDNFTYDGYSLFNAHISSKNSGSGTIEISYNNKTIGTVTVPTDLTQPPTVSNTSVSYSFIFSPGFRNTSVGDTYGEPRFDSSDVSKE